MARNKKKEEPIKQVSTFMQILPCALNEDEIKQRGRDLAKVHQDIAELEKRKKEVNSDIKSKSDALAASVAKLSRAISNGHEDRDVECTYAYFYEKGEKHVIRLDTEETVDIIPLTMAERQDRIDLKDKEEKAQDKGKKDEPEPAPSNLDSEEPV